MFKGQLREAQAENLSADPSNTPDGKFWLNTTVNRLKAYIQGAIRVLVTEDQTQTLTNKTLTSPTITTPTGIVKGDVGLGNCDNTSDANKPISTAVASALAAHEADTTNIHGIADTAVLLTTANLHTTTGHDHDGTDSKKVIATNLDSASATSGHSLQANGSGGAAWLPPVPVGTVLPYAANSSTNPTAPNGYLYCDGTAVSRATYSNLFALLSTSHGAGDGSTTFNLPDFRATILRGSLDGYTSPMTCLAASQVNVGTNEFTFSTPHGFKTGWPIAIIAPSGAPTGLTSGNIYQAIVVSSTVIKLAMNRLDAAAGTAVDITTTGSGTLQFHIAFDSNTQYLTAAGTTAATPSLLSGTTGELATLTGGTGIMRFSPINFIIKT